MKKKKGASHLKQRNSHHSIGQKTNKPAKPLKLKSSHNKGQKIIRWDENRMKMAIEEYKKGTICLRQLARAWNLPKSTLQRRIKGIVSGSGHASGRKCVFTTTEEEELGTLLKTLGHRSFPLTGSKVRQIAYQYAKTGKNGFSLAKGTAGYYWLKGFMARQHLSFRSPEALSVSRASGMNRTVVTSWFADLEKLMVELKLKDSSAHIWNCDESGLQEHFVQGRVISETGQPCYQVTCNEKGETTTVLACFNGFGEFCPPTVIFKAKRLKAEWLVGSPPGTLAKVSDSGWVTKEIFLEWAKSFISFLPK